MAQPRDPRYGLTDAVSTNPPDEQDKKYDDLLTEELKAQNEFESQQESQTRKMVLIRLERVLQALVKLMGQKQRLPAAILDGAGGKVFTYGSYELGVYGPGSDIDALMLAPKHVTRADFFLHVPDLLRKEFKPAEMSELTPVPGISVPIIKLELCGVPIDLIFCSLRQSSVTAAIDLSEVNVLRGLDDTDLRCINGTRVAKRMLELVPESKTFRKALRAVKLWAKRHALYGNIVGFPGGVAYALMVARVCQLYPRASASKILLKWFAVMKSWQWPTPLMLAQKEEAALQLREWDPIAYPADKYHLLPVLTPSYPRQNAIHTIGPSTKKVLMREMERANETVNQIYAGKATWKSLFQRHNFFTTAYKHYICVVTASKTKEAQQAWSGLVESRLKWLVQGIERSDASAIELVHPFNKGFVRVHECKTDVDTENTLHGSLGCQVKEIKTQTTEAAADPKVQGAAATDTDGKDVPMPDSSVPVNGAGQQIIHTTTFYLGIDLKPGSNSLDISEPISNYKKNCQEWDGYNADMHSIQIKHIRNFNLPGDVFVEGEVQPTKAKKKAAAPKAAAAPVDATRQKRTGSHAGLDENNNPAKRRQSGDGSNTPTANGVSTPNGYAR